jgi:hypothetical protein
MCGFCQEYIGLNYELYKRAAHENERPFILLLLVRIYRLDTSIRTVFQLCHFDVS